MTREPEATIELRVGSQILQMLVLRHYWLDRRSDWYGPIVVVQRFAQTSSFDVH